MDRAGEMARRVIRSITDWTTGLACLRQDALLYLLAALFCAGVAGLAVTADYRGWAEIALAPYLVAAIASESVFRLRRRAAGKAPRHQAHKRVLLDSGDAVSAFRRLLVLGVLCFAVLLPLGLQVTARADARGAVTNPHDARAQPEVAVIERAGDRFVHFEDPYLSHPTTVGVSPSNDNRSVNATSYFPYLPGMVLFGLANAAASPRELTDARVLLVIFTLAVVVLALYLVPASSRRRWRAFQFLLVLPTGALPIVTGGDDLPVLALLLLGLVLVRRRQPVWSGLAMGFAGILKWTAWPLILLGVLCAVDEDERPAMIRYMLATLVVALPVIGAGVALNPHAFLQNAILFPLGLTSVHSPAASPLLGQALVQLLPGFKKPLTVALVALGVIVVLVALVRHTPRTAYQAAFFGGWALAFATVIAPATRFGYFIYPANMLVWAYLLHVTSQTTELKEERGAGLSGEEEFQLASSTC